MLAFQEARHERVSTPLNIDQALDARDAIAKALYSALFSWLVRRVNLIVHKGIKKSSISILDIFGFETFKVIQYSIIIVHFIIVINARNSMSILVRGVRFHMCLVAFFQEWPWGLGVLYVPN